MATKTEVSLIDDVDGSEAEKTVRFMLDGTEYEIDLSTGNDAAMRNALRQYIEAARRISPNGKQPNRKGRQTGPRAIRVTQVPTHPAILPSSVPQVPFQAATAANGSAANGNPATTVEVREWAKRQGIDVKDRGRVPADVRERFTAVTGRAISNA